MFNLCKIDSTVLGTVTKVSDPLPHCFPKLQFRILLNITRVLDTIVWSPGRKSKYIIWPNNAMVNQKCIKMNFCHIGFVLLNFSVQMPNLKLVTLESFKDITLSNFSCSHNLSCFRRFLLIVSEINSVRRGKFWIRKGWTHQYRENVRKVLNRTLNILDGLRRKF